MDALKAAGLATLVTVFSTSCKQDSTEVRWHNHPTTIDVKHGRVVEHIRGPFALTDDTTYIADFTKNEFTRAARGRMFDFKDPVDKVSFENVTDPAVQRKIDGMRLLFENEKFQRHMK